MATTAFKELLQLISTGDSVNATTINKVLRELHGNDLYLKDLLDTAEIGSTVFARDATVESAAVVGMPVYYNELTQQYERGLAAATTDGTGDLVTAASSQIWGIIHNKTNSTLADILLFGYSTLDISPAVDSAVAAGTYYLSGATSGVLVQQSPAVTVPVLQSDGNGNVFVNPDFNDALGGHKHYRFDLVALPAGDHTNPWGGVHVITDADDTIEGWLPADDASFDGNAPDGARFGYNIAESQLANIWPPMPLGHATVEMHHTDDSATFTNGTVPAEFIVLDSKGIWWMRDCYGEVPWPTDFESTTPDSASFSSCPIDQDFGLVLWFTKMQFQTSNTVVTSLNALDDRLVITCAQEGDAATTGDLEIDLDLTLGVDPDDDESGYLAFKRMDADGILYRGPVVEGIIITGDLSAASTAEDSGTHQGIVTLTAASTPTGDELPIEEVRLAGTTEENYQDTLAIGFPSGKASEYRAKSRVPVTISGITTVEVRVRLWVLARVAGNIPALTFEYRIVSRETSATALPTVDITTIDFDVSGATGLTLDQYIEVATDEDISLAPGDQLLFTVGRDDSGGGDGFSGEVHVLDQRVTIVGVTP